MAQKIDGSGPLTAEEVAGTIAARQALGEQNEQAVIAAFLERTGYAIDARVDARIAAQTTHVSRPIPAETGRDRPSAWLALGSMLVAIPLTGIATQFSGGIALLMVLAAWIGIVAVNVSFNRH